MSTNKFCTNCGGLLTADIQFNDKEGKCPYCEKQDGASRRPVTIAITVSELSGIKKYIPEAVFKKVETMEPITQATFTDEFLKKKKRTGLTYVFFLLFLHYLYLGQVGLFFLYLLSAGACGLWTIADFFRIPKLVRDHNKSLALKVLQDIQVLR